MTKTILAFLLPFVLLTAGCIATPDAGPEPAEGSPRAAQASPAEKSSEPARVQKTTLINGVPCDGNPTNTRLATIEIDAMGGTQSLDFDIPTGTTQLWLKIDHEAFSAGRYEAGIRGSSGNLIEASALGAWGDNTSINVFSQSGKTVKAPTPGSYTLNWTGQGFFPAATATVHASVC